MERPFLPEKGTPWGGGTKKGFLQGGVAVTEGGVDTPNINAAIIRMR